MNADGSAVERLTTTDGTSDQPAWSPDGRQLAFVSSTGDGTDVFVLDFDADWQPLGPVPQARISIAPAAATNEVGDAHTFTVTRRSRHVSSDSRVRPGRSPAGRRKEGTS